MNATENYRRFLADAPGPKSGRGDLWLLEASWAARKAGISPHEAQYGIQQAMGHKPARAVARAVGRAYGATYTPRDTQQPKQPKADAARILADCARRYPEASDPACELTESSPHALTDSVEGDAALMLRTLYAADEFLYIGGAKERGEIGGNIRPVRDWLAYIEAGGALAEHFIPNPLTGREGITQDGTPTLRGDGCVSAWRYALVEFDNVPCWLQASFWLTTRLPVAAVIFSGSKSLHGLLEVSCANAEEWAREVRPLYRGILKDLGADVACSNAARMSRCPGVPRGDDFQRLVWLRARA